MKSPQKGGGKSCDKRRQSPRTRGGKSPKNIKKDEALQKLEERVRETRGGKATKTKDNKVSSFLQYQVVDSCWKYKEDTCRIHTLNIKEIKF